MSCSPQPVRLLALLLIVAGGGLACQTGATAPTPTNEPTATFEAPMDRYGLPAGRYQIEDGRVGRAETFSDVLDEQGVDYQTI